MANTKMTIRVILKNGAEIAVKCDGFTVKENGLGMVAGYDIQGITENKPVYLDLGQIAAIVRVMSDENTESADRIALERDKAVRAIGDIFGDIEQIRSAVDIDTEGQLGALCEKYCKKDGQGCYKPGDDSYNCKNFEWKGVE